MISKEYTDYLVHRDHRYLYKKKVNGKWRYYYDVGKTGYDKINGREQNAIPDNDNSRVKSYTKFQDVMGYDEQERFNRASAKIEQDIDQQNAYFDKANESGWTDKKAVTNSKYQDKVVKTSLKRYRDAESEYYKTPLGKVYQSKKAIKLGRNAVAKKFRG